MALKLASVERNLDGGGALQYRTTVIFPGAIAGAAGALDKPTHTLA